MRFRYTKRSLRSEEPLNSWFFSKGRFLASLGMTATLVLQVAKPLRPESNKLGLSSLELLSLSTARM